MTSYAADGSLNISVVDGSTYTGVKAIDGSTYVVQNDGTTTYSGAYHKCGALNVMKYVSGISNIRSPNGSLVVHVMAAPSNNTGQPVTVVSGVLT